MSGGLVLSFLRRAPRASDWSQQELAEFYRVESALLQGGLSVTTERGLTDEGDPWFVFCRVDNDEVIAHFARIDRVYVVVSVFQPQAVRGPDFRALIRNMLEQHPMVLPLRRKQGQKVFLHPSTLLLALLASSYFLASEKEPVGDHVSASAEGRGSSLLSFLRSKFAIITSAALAVTWLEHHAESVIKFVGGSTLLHLAPDEKTIHVASSWHDSAHFGIPPGVPTGVALGPHKPSQLASNLPASQQGDSGHLVPALHGHTALTQGIDSNPDAANGAAVASYQGEGSHAPLGDANALTGNDAQSQPISNAAVLAMEGHLSDAVPDSNAAGVESSSSVNSVVSGIEALQVAVSEINNSSVQPILLSNGGATVDVALQQAFQLATSEVHLGNDSGRDNSLGSSVASAHSSDLISPPPVQSVSLATSGSPAGPALSTDNGVAPSDIAQTVQIFLQHNPTYEITVSGTNVVIMDITVADVTSADFGVRTFDMNDGSTLSIVGIIPHHSAALAA